MESAGDGTSFGRKRLREDEEDLECNPVPKMYVVPSFNLRHRNSDVSHDIKLELTLSQGKSNFTFLNYLIRCFFVISVFCLCF